MRPIIIPALIATALFAASLPAGAAAPQAREDSDKLVLENDHVRVWFQGKKPMLKVFPTDNESAGFGYKFDQVVEYRDLNNDGLPAEAEILSRLNLHSASKYEVNVTQEPGRAVIELTLTDAVKLTGASALDNVTLPAGNDRQATIRLTFVIHQEDATIDANGTTVEVPATSIKYDFAVDRWPSLDAQNGRLALDMKVQGETADDGDGEATVEANGTRVGVLTWTDEAQGTTAAGGNVSVPVRAAVSGASNESRIVFTYDAANLATLVHDPTIGVADAEAEGDGMGGGESRGTGGNDAPGVGVLLVVGTTALVALARRASR